MWMPKVLDRACRFVRIDAVVQSKTVAAREAPRETRWEMLTVNGIVTICFSGTSSHACQDYQAKG
jgi:hypothetical protein